MTQGLSLYLALQGRLQDCMALCFNCSYPMCACATRVKQCLCVCVSAKDVIVNEKQSA